MSQLDKPSKRYRNVHADVFVIADDDDNGAYCVCLHAEELSIDFIHYAPPPIPVSMVTENLSASSSEEKSQEMVNISLYSGGQGISHAFPATEILDGREYPR